MPLGRIKWKFFRYKDINPAIMFVKGSEMEILVKTKNNLFHILSIIALVAGTIFSLVLIYVKDFVLKNSDVSAELVLGKLLSERGGILSSDWFYSTELRVFNSQIVYKYVFRIFHDNWVLVNIFSTVIMIALIEASFLFMCKMIGMGKEALYCASLLVWPFGPWYLRIILYGHFYCMNYVAEFLSLGLFFGILKGERKLFGNIIKGIFLALFAFIFGLGGIRIFIICYAPLLGTVVFYLWKLINSKFSNDATNTSLSMGEMKRAIIASLVANMAAAMGLVIHRRVLNFKYFVSDLFALKWGKIFSVSPLNDIIPDFFSLYSGRQQRH